MSDGRIRTVLTIAGSDCSGGAGIQADLKTFAVHGCYGMSVVTALTAQNTKGISAIMEIPSSMIREQLDQIFTDIRPDAVKIGMIIGEKSVRIVADRLRWYQAKRIVIDPVLGASCGRRLSGEEGRLALWEELFPLAALVTPNIPEAESFSGKPVRERGDMKTAARLLLQSGCGAVLIKGGHAPWRAKEATAEDLLLEKEEQGRWFSAPWVEQPNTHGTGCTLSSAVACGLAAGKSLVDSVADAKYYVEGALLYGLDLGAGNGPLNHCWDLSRV